jgi:transposase-like protein
MNELKNRGANDLLIAVVDGLKGLPHAINAVFRWRRYSLNGRNFKLAWFPPAR